MILDKQQKGIEGTPTANISLDYLIDEQSPVKKGKLLMYFDGYVTDGDLQIQIVGLAWSSNRNWHL